MQLLRAILTPLVAAAVLATAAPLVQAQNRGDDTLLEMHQAFRKGDRKKLEQLLPAARGHALEPWAAYWELKLRLGEASPAPAAAAGDPPDAPALTLVIEQLDALLADSDGAAVGFWEAHAGHFDAVCPTHARAVTAALADFDFDLARDALRACSDALGSPSS